MFGALIGDLIGSVYEWNNIKHKTFEPLIATRAFITDDSVLTVAVADALLNQRDMAASLKDWGLRYPNSDWGGRFRKWLFSEDSAPYNSFGNGAAMRASPAALLGASLDDALELARLSALPTHDHPEGVKGAQTTVLAIHLARQGKDAAAIRAAVAEFSGYDMNRSVDDIRPGYRFDVTCQGSVPEALICALEATSFEDAMRNSISIGGDSDTVAAIAGPVTEALFGIPEPIALQTWAKVPKDMRDVIERLYEAAMPALPSG